MGATDTTSSKSSAKALAARVAELEARVAELTRARDTRRASYERLRLDVELLQRRITVAKAERVDTAQLELEFASKLAALDALTSKLDARNVAPPSGDTPNAPPRKPPKARRDLREANLDPRVRTPCRA